MSRLNDEPLLDFDPPPLERDARDEAASGVDESCIELAARACALSCEEDVDIAPRAVEGVLLPGHPAAVENLTDGALSTATINYTPDGAITGDATFSLFRATFPYLQTPLSGSPGPIHP